jgi:hypothetical protein
MNYKALLGTAIVSGVLGYLMNTDLFTPTLSADAVAAAAAAAMVPAYAMWAVTSVIGAFVISWVTGMTGNGVKSGLVIAVSQIVLVDVFYVLDGRRALAAAAASAVVLLVSGVASGYTFGKLSASKA